MFCSSDCKRKAFIDFHHLECPLMELIISTALTSTMRMALRTFFKALSLFDGSVEELEMFLNLNEKSFTIFDVENPGDSKKNLLVINSLIFSDKIKCNENVFEDIFSATTELKFLWSTHSDFIMKFIRKQNQIGTMNYHEVYCWPLKKGGLEDPELENIEKSLAYKRGIISTGTGSYPFCSLFNHHCAPNVNRVYVNDKIFVVVQRTIEQGDQLFDNYGYIFTNVSKENRQDELLKQYKFKCSCEACVNDWPFLPSLKIRDKICLLIAKKACKELSIGGISQDKAKEKFKQFCKVAQEFQKIFPSLEICSLAESINAFLELSLKPKVQIE